MARAERHLLRIGGIAALKRRVSGVGIGAGELKSRLAPCAGRMTLRADVKNGEIARAKRIPALAASLPDETTTQSLGCESATGIEALVIAAAFAFGQPRRRMP